MGEVIWVVTDPGVAAAFSTEEAARDWVAGMPKWQPSQGYDIDAVALDDPPAYWRKPVSSSGASDVCFDPALSAISAAYLQICVTCSGSGHIRCAPGLGATRDIYPCPDCSLAKR